VTDLTVYAVESRADVARALLTGACVATGSTLRLELYGSGSLYQRLGPRHGPPPPDIVFWFGAFAARSAALDGLLQPYQPSHVADGVVHDPDWKWLTLDYSPIGVLGPSLSNWTDVAGVPRLAIADPERSEVGLSILLSSLDRIRQVEGDVERGWTWWQQRAQSGLQLAEDDQSAASMVDDGSATHALTLSPTAVPLVGLAPIPHAIGIPTASRNLDGARRVLDWLTSESAASSGIQRFSPWQATSNGLAALLQAAPPLDIEWTPQQYTATRQRWAQSGFGPGFGLNLAG
jgi:ABC-type Fe3+ transport system substrate-binding protein